MNTYMKRILAVIISVAIILGLCACEKKEATKEENPVNNSDTTDEKKPVSYDTAAESYNKNETVYINMNADGDITSKIVTDWIHTDKAQTYVDDISDLSDIKNVKNDVKPVIGKDGNVRWNMQSTDLYYRGTSEKELPVKIKINYFLDGKEVKAKDIAGKKGQVKMVVSFNNESAKTIKVDGKDTKIYTPFIVAGGMILQESQFSNITVENGKTIGDGTKEIALMVGVPGLKESLSLDEKILKQLGDFDFSNTYTITADTEKFEVSNMVFAVLPLSAIESEIQSSLPATLDEVKSTLSQVQGIVDKFNSLNLTQLMNTLFSNSDKLIELTGSISEVTKLYNENKALIDVIGKYMTEENINNIKKLTEDTKDVNLDEVTRLLSNPVLQVFFKQLPTIAQDVQALTPLAEGLKKDLSDPAVKKAIDNLPHTLETLKKLQKEVDANQELFKTLENSLDSKTIASLQELMKSLDGMLKDDTVEKYLNLAGGADSLVLRVKEWVKAGQQYNLFTKAGKNAKTSVMFVFETESISAPAEKKTKVETTEKDKSWFKKLFDKND